MPDISLLVELAELYDVSIPEIIDGERKSETMEREVKEVAEKMSDYAGTEKETLIKNIRNLSLMGVCALAVYFLLDTTGAALQNAILESIYVYCQTLIYVTTLLIPLYTTGLLGKFEQRKKSKRFDCMPGPVRIIICVIGAFAVAAAVQILLSNIPIL